MTSRFTFELTRQALRWLGVWLMTMGLPAEMGATFEDPQFVAAVAGFVSYAIADGFWIVAKVREYGRWIVAKVRERLA